MWFKDLFLVQHNRQDVADQIDKFHGGCPFTFMKIGSNGKTTWAKIGPVVRIH